MITQIKKQNIVRQRRAKRVRAKLFGTREKPRLSVFRSAKHIYAQLIDDEKRTTLLAVSDVGSGKNTKEKTETKKRSHAKGEASSRKVRTAYEVGKALAEKAKKMKITHVVFDRGRFTYHGRIKSLAHGARDGGLQF